MSITIRKAADRGHADHGWLKAAHTFSFADYQNPEFTTFGPLRVLNHDVIEGGGGFPTHGHADMEIITYVLRGSLAHKDSMGNVAQITAGEVQVMSAGSGLRHSEFNASETEQAELLQMWLFPMKEGVTPRWDQKPFSEQSRRAQARLIASPDGRDGSLMIGQDSLVYAGLLNEGESCAVSLAAGRGGWIHVGRGKLQINGVELGVGDGAGILDEADLKIEGIDDADFVIFDLPM